MTQVAERAEQAYLTEYERFAARQGGRAPAWLRELRATSARRFAEVGFPTTHDEEWRATSVAPLAGTPMVPAPDDDASVLPTQLERYTFPEGDASVLVFVNGRYSPRLSATSGLPPGVRAGNLADERIADPALLQAHLGRYATPEQHAFTALNTAFLDEGAFIEIPRHVVVDAPIHLLFVTTPGHPPAVSHPRTLVIAGERCQARLVETYAALDGSVYFTNAVTEVVLGDGAVVDHYKVQRESLRAFHIGTMYVRAHRGGSFASHAILMGGALVRNEVVSVLAGEGFDCTLNGVYFVDGDRLVDTHTTIDHAMPHCGSHEVYKGILAGHGRAVFNGKIMVRPDAQKTDAKQTNKALLLSDDATINTKPQLEIFADDVKCTHGAAIGQMDEDAIFYLRARGIGLREARTMLVHAFLGEILEEIKIAALREHVEADLFAILPEVREGELGPGN